MAGGNGGGGGNNDGMTPMPQTGAPSGTYRTVCVRSCDGYYFPISYATTAERFAGSETKGLATGLASAQS